MGCRLYREWRVANQLCFERWRGMTKRRLTEVSDLLCGACLAANCIARELALCDFVGVWGTK